MTTASYAANTQVPAKPKGWIAQTLTLLIEVLCWLAFALFFNVAVELIGLFFRYWEPQGVEHSATMLRVELNWLNADFKQVFGNPGQTSVQFAQSFYDTFFVWMGVDVITSLSQTAAAQPFLQYFEATINMINLFAIRLVVLVFSFPVFFAFGSIGLIDGLSQRDLRRFGGDRESSYFWNRAVRFIKPMFLMPFVIYLASPLSIHPNWAILPFSICFGFTVWLSCLKFKKYL